MKLSQNLLVKTVAVAIAATGVLYSSSTFAEVKSPNPATSTIAQANTMMAQTGTIVDIASSNPRFKTLVTAIKAAGLVDTLSGQGPFTVFAPTDAAFKQLPKGTLEKLLQPENKDTLAKILTYHVVSGEVDAKDIQPGDVVTVEGSSVKISKSQGRVRVNNATVIKADVKASNGVIHVINKVLLPPDVQL